MKDQGAAGVALLGVVGFVLMLTVALATVVGVQQARLRATSAADAAALAAAPVTFLPFGAKGTPTDEAARFARLNGASLVSCRCAINRSFEPRTVEVRVRTSVGLAVLGTVTVEATGRAEFTPALLLGSVAGSG